MLRVGLLGAGRIGRVHAHTITAHPHSQLYAVSDVFEENAQKLAQEHGTQVRTSEDILQDTDIDAVLIATSTDTHSSLIEAAAQAGKHILCEKPVDLDLQRAVACQKQVAQAGRSVMIGFNRRFDPNFKHLKSALDRGDVGNAEMLCLTSFDPAPPPVDYIKVSGGLFRDMMIHDFDMANFIMGGAPETIMATGSALVDPAIAQAGDIDTAIVTLTYADGRVCVIKNSRRAAYGYDQRVELLGSKGLLQVNNILENSVVTSTVDGVNAAKPMHFFLERYMPAYKDEWDCFVTAVREQTRMPVTLDDGVLALAMAQAADQSHKKGQPVKLEEVYDL